MSKVVLRIAVILCRVVVVVMGVRPPDTEIKVFQTLSRFKSVHKYITLILLMASGSYIIHTINIVKCKGEWVVTIIFRVVWANLLCIMN